MSPLMPCDEEQSGEIGSTQGLLSVGVCSSFGPEVDGITDGKIGSTCFDNASFGSSRLSRGVLLDDWEIVV